MSTPVLSIDCFSPRISRDYMTESSPGYEGDAEDLREDRRHQQHQQVTNQEYPLHPHHNHHHHHHHHHHNHSQEQQQQQQQSHQPYGQLGAGEVPIPEGGDSRQRVEASLPSDENRVSSHMPHSTMLRYSAETLSLPTEHHNNNNNNSNNDNQHHQTHHHQHHLSDPHQHQQHNSLNLHRHLDGQQSHQETVERVSGLVSATRVSRSDYSLGQLFPNVPISGTTRQVGVGVDGSTPGHHHHQQLVDEVLPEDAYIQHHIRTARGAGGGSGDNGDGSPHVRTGSSPGSSRSPHDEQQGISSPHRHSGQTDGGYSPSNQERLQSFTHLTAMQPPSSAQGNHSLQDNDRVSDLLMESIYNHHSAAGTLHHHQEHEQTTSSPHSPSGNMSRSVKKKKNF